MDSKSFRDRTPTWTAVLFVVLYLTAFFIVNEIVYSDNFGYKLPRINSEVVGARWVYFEQE
jgi:hypothetical protein